MPEVNIRQIFSDQIDQVNRELEIEETKDLSRFFYLRPSAFPYCGIRTFLDSHGSLHLPRLMSFSGAFYTGVGSTVHSVFQKYLGRAGVIIGDWECPKCHSWKRFAKLQHCDTCKIPMHYRELEIKDSRGLAGHLDTLFEEPFEEKELWVVDYKTTSMKDIEKHRKTGKVFPHRVNVHQILAYVVLLEHYFKIKIKGWMLVYLPRDNPFKDRIVISGRPSEKKRARELKKIQRWIKIHRLMLRTSTEEQAQTLWKYKLCDSRKDYFENYYDHFDKCNYVDGCFNHAVNTLIEETLKKGLATKVYPLIEHAPKKIRKELKL